MPRLQFFPHDSDAAQDWKCKQLIFKRGWAGYGLWWRLCELMAGSSDQRIPFGTDMDKAILAHDLMMDARECEALVEDLAEIGLVIPDYLPEFIRSERMAANALQAIKRSESARKAGRASAEKKR